MSDTGCIEVDLVGNRCIEPEKIFPRAINLSLFFGLNIKRIHLFAGGHPGTVYAGHTKVESRGLHEAVLGPAFFIGGTGPGGKVAVTGCINDYLGRNLLRSGLARHQQGMNLLLFGFHAHQECV